MHTILNCVILYMLAGLLVDLLSVLLITVEVILFIYKKQGLEATISGELKQKILDRIGDFSALDRILELVFWPVYQPIHCVRFHKMLWSIEL